MACIYSCSCALFLGHSYVYVAISAVGCDASYERLASRLCTSHFCPPNLLVHSTRVLKGHQSATKVRLRLNADLPNGRARHPLLHIRRGPCRLHRPGDVEMCPTQRGRVVAFLRLNAINERLEEERGGATARRTAASLRGVVSGALGRAGGERNLRCRGPRWTRLSVARSRCREAYARGDHIRSRPRRGAPPRGRQTSVDIVFSNQTRING
jgi:hypothetical protein